MKIYRIQRWIEPILHGDPHWHDIPGGETQSIKYAQGFQDAVQTFHPNDMTRIVWVRGIRFEVVRERPMPTM